MDAANLVQYLMGDSGLELWYRHLGHKNVKDVYTLQNMVSDMNYDKKIVPHPHRFVEWWTVKNIKRVLK